jgi:hypothetical protein
MVSNTGRDIIWLINVGLQVYGKEIIQIKRFIFIILMEIIIME